MTKPFCLGWVPGGTGEVSPFDQIFGRSLRLDPMNKPEDIALCNAIVVWGGADISPSIYKEPVSKMCGATASLSNRDKIEVSAMWLAVAAGVPIIGVCRGAQLACALAGGKLVQHVHNHGRTHLITTDDGRSISTSSVHHQMMYPFDVDHQMIAWANEVRSDVHIMGDESDITMGIEPEIVYFPGIRALAIQGHPEFMSESSEFVQYCNDLVTKYLLIKEESHA